VATLVIQVDTGIGRRASIDRPGHRFARQRATEGSRLEPQWLSPQRMALGNRGGHVVNCSAPRRDQRSAIALLAALFACGSALNLPRPGTQIPLLPPGEGREVAQKNCLACHASEMLLQQQLTEMQWRTEVEKMEHWGADVRDEDKEALVQYLVSRFGPDNDRFTPIVVSPHQRPDAGPNGGAR
jgi:mono/diheme cytochrome c family protein